MSEPLPDQIETVYALDDEIRTAWDSVRVAEGQEFVIVPAHDAHRWLSPDQARHYARRLMQAAEQAERGPVPVQRASR